MRLFLGFLLIEETHSQDFSSLGARMVSEVEALYAETRAETGLASMSPAVRAALAKVERGAHRGRHAGEAGFRARLGVQGLHLGDHARTQGRKILRMGFFNQ